MPSSLFKNIDYGFCGVAGGVPACHHVKQVHGTSIVAANSATLSAAVERSPADGLYLLRHDDSPIKTIAVKTADCLPVLLSDASGAMIMAVHAGWRGLTAGILNQAINIFREHGLRDIKAVIGPSIGPCCFEVREDVVEAVSHGAWGLKSPERIIKKTDDTWHIDLAKGAGLSLQDLGVAHVETSNVCTKHDVTWFSFRRQKKVEGSNYAWIGFASAVNSASTPST